MERWSGAEPLRSRLSRRKLLRQVALGGTGLAAAVALACGTSSKSTSTSAGGTQVPKAGFKYKDPGISDSEIKIGYTTGLTGAAAIQLVVIAGAYRAYIRKVNEEQGGVAGRKINLEVIDDGLVPDRIAANVRRLIDQDKVFAIGGSTAIEVGTVAVQDFINQRKAPWVLLGDGLIRFGPPSKFPWFDFGTVNYSREGFVQGQHILQNFPNAKVGMLRMNNNLGKDYEVGLRQAFGDKADKMLVSIQTFDGTESSMDTQVIALRDSGADVWFNMSLANINILAMNKAYQIGWKPKQIYLTPHSAGINQLSLLPKEITTGALALTTLKVGLGDPKFTGDPAVQRYTDTVKKYASDAVKDPNDPLAAEGYTWGLLLVRFLQDMFTKYQPTREGFMAAARSFGPWDLDGLALPGVNYQGSKNDQDTVRNAVRIRFDGKIYQTEGGAIPLTASA